MLKKDINFRWLVESNKSFTYIKKDLFEAPILVSPNFDKDFMIFSFVLENTIVGVLLQRNERMKSSPLISKARP